MLKRKINAFMIFFDHKGTVASLAQLFLFPFLLIVFTAKAAKAQSCMCYCFATTKARA
jgi:hypothetical protein